MRGWSSGWPGQAHRCSGAGEDQTVAVEVEPVARERSGGQPPAAVGEIDAVDLGEDRLDGDP